jgi:hypothetical protein
MKALTVLQPYAELIADGEKTVENRSWPTNHRGLLLIHAGKSKAFVGQDTPLPTLPRKMDYGAIVAICELVDCVHYTPGRGGVKPPSDYRWLETYVYAEGSQCWILDNIRRLPHVVPCNGQQGLWEVNGELLALVEKQLRILNKPAQPTRQARGKK